MYRKYEKTNSKFPFFRRLYNNCYLLKEVLYYQRHFWKKFVPHLSIIT